MFICIHMHIDIYYNPIEHIVSNLLFYYLKCKSWKVFFIIKYTFTVYFYYLTELNYVDRQ